MGVYIKGMEMPKNCWMCPLSVLFEKPREMLRCKLTKEEVLRYKIDGNCPLIEVPPHGRLIDADAISEDDRQVYGFYNNYDLQQLLDNAPTIIEAEEKK